MHLRPPSIDQGVIALVWAVEVPETLFGQKYSDGTFQADGRHAWLRLAPEKIVSWDFRKMADARLSRGARSARRRWTA